ncbi:MAG: hypothetical protein ACK5LO_16370 [Leucobacter sp.]
MTTTAKTLNTATGVLLIAAPLIAVVLKLFSFGWLMVILIMGPVLLLLAGYVVQVVIAAQGFLSRRALFGEPRGRARTRALIAAWLTSIGVMLAAIFAPDGGDSGYGSTLQVWMGVYGPNADAVHSATDALNDALFSVTALAWLAGFVWLFVEWIIALVRRRRERVA